MTGDLIIFRDFGVLVHPPDVPGPKLYLRCVNDEEEKNDDGMKLIRGERERLSIRRANRKRR